MKSPFLQEVHVLLVVSQVRQFASHTSHKLFEGLTYFPWMQVRQVEALLHVRQIELHYWQTLLEFRNSFCPQAPLQVCVDCIKNKLDSQEVHLLLTVPSSQVLQFAEQGAHIFVLEFLNLPGEQESQVVALVHVKQLLLHCWHCLFESVYSLTPQLSTQVF
jgi:hypothetical protein